MTWFRVDDKLHDHRKTRKAGKAAMGVWVLAGSWCMDNSTDGFVPDDVLARWGTRADASRLVACGLWVEDQHEGESGWRFHDWSRFQPSAETTAAWRAAESEAGQRGNHKRWHKDRGVTDPNCQYCYRVPDQVPDQVPDGVTRSEPESGGESGSDRVGVARNPYPYPTTSSNDEVGTSEPPRLDVERVCEHLANAIEANGSKRPEVNAAWRRDARLLMDKDGRTEQQVIAAIDWCQYGETEKGLFWRPNVMSMHKLRKQYDQMRLQAESERRQTQPRQTRTQEHLALVQELRANEQGGGLPQIGGGER